MCSTEQGRHEADGCDWESDSDRLINSKNCLDGFWLPVYKKKEKCM